jgi:hypothetical protein
MADNTVRETLENIKRSADEVEEEIGILIPVNEQIDVLTELMSQLKEQLHRAKQRVILSQAIYDSDRNSYECVTEFIKSFAAYKQIIRDVEILRIYLDKLSEDKKERRPNNPIRMLRKEE